MTMKKINLFLLFATSTLLIACQSTPRPYNGVIGYQIENKTTSSATLAYTLAARTKSSVDEKKLQQACKQVLGAEITYQIKVLSVSEIINPPNKEQFGVKLGNSRATFGLSNSPDLNNSEGYATHQALEARPSTLNVVRYTCS